MAFEQTVQLMDFLPWVLVVMAVGLVVLVMVKIVSTYRDMKRAKAEKQRLDNVQKVAEAVEQRLMEIRNEYLVMSRNVQYAVGVDKQLREGKYILKSAADNETTFNIRYNGLVREFCNGDTVMLTTDDTLCPVSGAVLIKPYID